MLLYVIFGIIIGAGSIVFAMENTAPITVTFLDWHATAPLALILLNAVLFGIIIVLLSMVPQAIRNALDTYAAQRELKKKEVTATYTSTLSGENVVA